MRPHLQLPFDHLLEEAEATRHGPNHWYTLDEAVSILLEERVERGILTPTERDEIVAERSAAP